MSVQIGGVEEANQRFPGFLVLVADIWTILNVVQSRGTNVNKLLWVLAILFLPVLGFIIWLIFGPRGQST